MSDEATREAEIAAEPIFQASMRLESGPTVYVTLLGNEALVGVRDRDGRAVAARMTGSEARRFASLLNQADLAMDQ